MSLPMTNVMNFTCFMTFYMKIETEIF